MKITLIYPNIGNIPSYNFGLGIIAAYLKQNGHNVQGLYISSETEKDIDLTGIEKQIKEFRPGLIAFSCVSNQYKFVKQIAKYLKDKKINAKILVGGVHATIAPEEILKEDFMDMACLGEGEEAVLELAEKLEKQKDTSNIKNIWLKKDGKIIKNKLRPLIKDLGSLPFADRSLFSFKETLKKKRGWVNIQVSRGCPFQCSYCVNHYYAKLNKEWLKIRMRPFENILAEIAEIEKKHMIKTINFTDDAFTMNKEWTLKFCKEYSRRFKKYPFACNARATNFGQDLASILKDAGCVEVKIGLESGSKEIRKNALNRQMADLQIKKAFSAAKKAGIRAWAYNMIGIPGETKEDVLKTIRLNADIRPYILRCSILFPYKGTDLYEKCVKENLLDENRQFKYASYFDGTILKLKHLKETDILRYKTMFKWYVDAHSKIEAAPFYKKLVDLFEELPEQAWVTGKAQELFRNTDKKVDDIFKSSKKEHYSSRGHLDLNFSALAGWSLP